MTRLDFRRTLRREVQINNRVYVLAMDAGGVVFRQKGHRSRVSIGWIHALQLAERLAGERRYLEQVRARSERRVLRRFAR